MFWCFNVSSGIPSHPRIANLVTPTKLIIAFNYLSSSQAQLWNIIANTHRAGISFSGLPSPPHPAVVLPLPLVNRRTRVGQGFQHNQGPDPLQSPHAQKRFLPGLCLILFSFCYVFLKFKVKKPSFPAELPLTISWSKNHSGWLNHSFRLEIYRFQQVG